MNADAPSAKPRILVIDDTVEIHQVFRRLLSPRVRPVALAEHEAAIFGATPASVPDTYELDFAQQGEAGLECVRRAQAEGRPYAMAFVDMRMPPGWDGMQTIEAIWRDQPDLEIVICTAHADYTDLDILNRLGSSNQALFLRKPFEAIEVKLLARALTKKWALRAQMTRRAAGLQERISALGREVGTSLAAFSASAGGERSELATAALERIAALVRTLDP